MAYRKTIGVLVAYVIGYTPYWIDARLSKSKEVVCVFLKYKMSDRLKHQLDYAIEHNFTKNFVVRKRKNEQGHYDYLNIVGHRSQKHQKSIAMEALDRELSLTYNPVRGKSDQKLLTGRAGIPTFTRTGTKLQRAIHQSINDSERREKLRNEQEQLREQRQKERELRKLRRKFLYDREWMMLPLKNGGTDAEWDAFLWEHKSDLANKNRQRYKDLERELKALGLV